MPDEVILDVTTIEENVTVETTAGDVVEIQVVAPTGPTGATGPAGPNSVTSATTSDGTANLTLNNVSTASFTAGNSSTTSGEITIFTNGPVFQWRSDTVEYGERGFTFLTTDITSEVNYTLPNASGTLAITGNTNGEPDKLTSGTISGATTFNATSYTYGTGAAAAHRTALGVTSTQLQTESLFSLLTFQESDSGSYTANAGTATASQDGDSLSLSATTANQRPNVYRFRNWNRNPGVSGTANAVIPVRLACAGNIYHLGSGANGASFRCGFGMVNGASAVAANANATTGRGFGWRIAWNSSTSKLEFNLWAHDGTTYVEGAGIDTGIGAGNLDGFFNIIVGLASDGTVSANTWFGSSTSTSAVPSSTPTVTLAGGPTSGNFANLGTPSWIVAAHSTNAPASGNSIIARILNRKLALG